MTSCLVVQNSTPGNSRFFDSFAFFDFGFFFLAETNIGGVLHSKIVLITKISSPLFRLKKRHLALFSGIKKASFSAFFREKKASFSAFFEDKKASFSAFFEAKKASFSAFFQNGRIPFSTF